MSDDQLKKIVILADGYHISDPSRTDGTIKFTFLTGEYELPRVAELLKIPRDTALKVTIEIPDY